MYTATLKSKSLKTAQRRIEVIVTISDGVETFDEIFSFSFNTTVEQIKRTVKTYLDELNGAPTKVESLTDLTYIEPAPEPEKTADELAKEAWHADWAKLSAIQPYIDAGVFTGSETAIVNLRNKIKTGFKPEYLGL